MKEIEINGVVFSLRPINAGRYYELMEQYHRTNDQVALSRNLIFHSITGWSLKGVDGVPLPLEMKNFLEYVTVDCLSALDEAVAEVNGLSEARKKA